MVSGRVQASFEWPVNTKGHQVDGRRASDNQAGIDVLRDRQLNGPSPFDLRWAHSIDEEPGLFRTFAALDPTRKGALEAFADRFGSLRARSGAALTEPVDDWIRASGAMRDAVDTWLILRGEMRPEPQKAGTVDPRALHAQLVRTLSDALTPIRLGMTADEQGASTITVTPPDLLTAMWWQFAVAVAEGKDFKKCRREACDRWIEITHSKGGTRSTREFCTHACRMRWARAQAAKARAAQAPTPPTTGAEHHDEPTRS